MEPGPPARILNWVTTPSFGDLRFPPAKPFSELMSTRVQGLAGPTLLSCAQLRGGFELLGSRLIWAPNWNAELAAGSAMRPTAANSAERIAIRFIFPPHSVLGVTRARAYTRPGTRSRRSATQSANCASRFPRNAPTASAGAFP